MFPKQKTEIKTEIRASETKIARLKGKICIWNQEATYIALQIQYIILQMSFLSNYILLFRIYSSPQYQVVHNTVRTAEFPGSCVPRCAFTGDSHILWSDEQCQKNSLWRNWFGAAISWADERESADQHNSNTQWFQVGTNQVKE